jgi:hypothetical protein
LKQIVVIVFDGKGSESKWRILALATNLATFHQHQGGPMGLRKNRPNCDPTHFLSKRKHSLNIQKVSKNVGYFSNFQNDFQSKQLPNGRKFAQSGHPAHHQNIGEQQSVEQQAATIIASIAIF